MPKDHYVFFDDMLLAIDKIKKYVRFFSYDSFSEDELRADVQNALLECRDD